MALTLNEQLMVELINAARADPRAEAARLGIGLNDGIGGTPISAARKQPLAVRTDLATAADGHARWMEQTDVFSHTGADGSSATERILASGWAPAPGSGYGTGENIALRVSSVPGSLRDGGTIVLQHEALFRSPGHRQNILDGAFSEIGIGQAFGAFAWDSTLWPEASLVAQKFADGGRTYLTGVVIDDRDGDGFYDIGEGLGGVTITVTGNGETRTTTSWDAGGWTLAAWGDGTYTVIFSGGPLPGSVTKTAFVSGGNVKVDAERDEAGVTAPSTGTPGNDVLQGTAGADIMAGLGGDDVLKGSPGADHLDGGPGPDTAEYLDSPSRVVIDMMFPLEGDGDGRGDTFNDVEAISGSRLDDVLLGNDGNNVLFGNDGDDVLAGRGGRDHLAGGDGDDRLHGGADRDALVGGRGRDLLDGGPGTDTAEYLGASSRVVVDMLVPLEGDGQGHGDAFDAVEVISGSRFGDGLLGNGGGNVLFGNDGDDVLAGRDGNDVLVGGGGDDTLHGGADEDVFVFRFGEDRDEIRDFEEDVDTLDIDLAGFGFASLAELLAGQALVQAGANVVFQPGGGDSVTILNVLREALVDDIA